ADNKPLSYPSAAANAPTPASCACKRWTAVAAWAEAARPANIASPISGRDFFMANPRWNLHLNAASWQKSPVSASIARWLLARSGQVRLPDAAAPFARGVSRTGRPGVAENDISCILYQDAAFIAGGCR